MRNDEFKRRLRQLVREELLRLDMRAIIQEAIEGIDFGALIREQVEHEQFYMKNSAGPVQQRVLH